MHMADALVSPQVAGAMYVAAGAAATVAIKKVREENDPKKIPVMGVMGAFVFAAQMINFTIPGTGSSGHICGGILVSAILGPFAGFLTMIGVLLTQCLFFADGGLLALGCNVWNMAFYGCFIGSLLIWKPIMKGGLSNTRIILASILGCILTLQMGAFSVCLETTASGISELPLSGFMVMMQPIHLAIGLVEGLITAAVLCFISQSRSELLWGIREEDKAASTHLSTGKVVGVMTVITVLVGGGLSLFASGLPDGLEWALERVAGTAELTAEGSAYGTAESIQSALSFLPDYAFPGSESAAGTTVSGLVGAVIVAAICAAVVLVIGFFRRKNAAE